MKNMKFLHRRVIYLDSGFNAIKVEVLHRQVFYLIGGHCILFLRERGRNLESKAILTKDEQHALHLYKTRKKYKYKADVYMELREMGKS